MRSSAVLRVALWLLPAVQAIYTGYLEEPLPFPGPWESYIQAPASRIVRPEKVYYTEGSVSTSDSTSLATLKGQGALVTFEFAQNIAGRLFFELGENTITQNQSIGIAYTESPRFIGRQTDGTGDIDEYDLSLFLPLVPGQNAVSQDHVRGAFKYVTLFIPHPNDPQSGEAAPYIESIYERVFNPKVLSALTIGDQQPLLPDPDHPLVGVKDLWVEYTAFPSVENPRRYTGYFYSNDNLLNRIWYAGAYTLQLTTVPPSQGGTLIDFNKHVDGNTAPTGSWYSNYTISNGTSVTTDGAKRDRMVYAGDMTIAVPGIALSTYDLISVKNALDTLFDHYYHSSSNEIPGRIRLPYAGPPMGFNGEFSDTYHMHALLGVYQYVLYSADLSFLRNRWEQYVQALQYSLDKVLPTTGLMYVTSGSDWLRGGQGKENIEANGILYKTLMGSIKLAQWLTADGGIAWKDIEGRGTTELVAYWTEMMAGIKTGIMAEGRLWNVTVGLFSDNPEDRRDIFPQDGNSWAVLSHLVDSDIAVGISKTLKTRWGPYGAPCPEMASTISPFASSFELQAHVAAGEIQTALDLIRLQWGYMLDGPGFTNSTFVEGYRVDGDIKYPAYNSITRNSHAHGWSTGPTSMLTASLLGIELLSPAGKEWAIEPKTGDLERVEGGFETDLGKFVVKWEKESEFSEASLEIETPVGTRGVVAWGGVRGLSVMGGGKWKWVKRGARVMGGKVGSIAKQMGSGEL
ncbi:hypothetical protein RUND412_009644 [Rhizina undulata]